MQQATTIIVITQPRIILKILTWCIVITILIKAVTLTYIISDILIVIFGINISCKCMFSTTLRTVISSTTSSISFKSIYNSY